MRGYDKMDTPRPGYDPSDTVVQYVRKAASDGVQLVAFPEYLLGRISVPGPQTEKIGQAAAAGRIYVIVGCWEVYEDGKFANTALLFDRSGKIAGKYHKPHAAVDQFEGTPPWSAPPKGKDADWFIRNDPEWAMQRGEDLPVFDLDFGRIGILTCYDGWFPETFRVLSLKGAELLVWINGRGGGVEDFIIKSAMFQDEVAIVATNQAYGAGTASPTSRAVSWPNAANRKRPTSRPQSTCSNCGRPGTAAGISGSDAPTCTERSSSHLAHRMGRRRRVRRNFPDTDALAPGVTQLEPFFGPIDSAFLASGFNLLQQASPVFPSQSLFGQV